MVVVVLVYLLYKLELGITDCVLLVFYANVLLHLSPNNPSTLHITPRLRHWLDGDDPEQDGARRR